jgi:nucleoside-diphosphate-sugar epimerase
MRIFLAGGTGAIGRRLIPMLVADGHQVIASTRFPSKFEDLRSLGAEPVEMDGLNRDEVLRRVVPAKPDVVIHQMTAIATVRDWRNLDRSFAETNRLRVEGTKYLMEAARQAGARRLIAQSYTGWPNERKGSRIKTEADPLDPNPPSGAASVVRSAAELERIVPAAEGLTGIVLRYGAFYGPGTSIAFDGDLVQRIRAGKLPLIGGGAGVWSFIHVDDAANATRLAVDRGSAGLYNITDNEPAEAAVWLPYLASVLGAPEPKRIPAWIARLVVGDMVVSTMTKARGSSNAKARRELRWEPGYSTWRDGFRTGLGEPDKSLKSTDEIRVAS